MNLRAFVYRWSYPVARLWWRLRRPHVRAAAAIVSRGDQVLLIRKTYGQRQLWNLPGGLVGYREDPGVAAVRETAEETGLILHGAKHLTTLRLNDDGRRVTLSIYQGRGVGTVKIDPGEIAEGRWFRLGAVPPLGEGTERALERFRLGLHRP